MKWFLWGRQYGKTYQTIKWFLEDPENRVIISFDEREAERLRRQIWDEQRPVRQPCPAEEADKWKELLKRSVVSVWSWQRSDITGVRNGAQRKVAVDNLDLVLPALLGADVAMVTATGVSESARLLAGPGEARERIQQQMEAEEQ